MVTLVPISFLMGVRFPSGIRIINTLSSNLVPWAWGVNGCVSVISSILALMIALRIGFSWVMIVASGVYLIAMGVSYYWLRRVRQLGRQRIS